MCVRVCVSGHDEEVVGGEKRFLGMGSAKGKAGKCWAHEREQTISGAQGRAPRAELGYKEASRLAPAPGICLLAPLRNSQEQLETSHSGRMCTARTGMYCKSMSPFPAQRASC